MIYFDIAVGGLMCYSFYKGIINGLFIELASLLSLLLGIYIAIEFSDLATEVVSHWVKWNPYTIQVIAFILVFIVVVIGIYLLGKILTNIADFAYLGWPNGLLGGIFRVLKTVLIIGVCITAFKKINNNSLFVKKETLDKSLLYNPIQKITVFIFPIIEKWYDKAQI